MKKIALAIGVLLVAITSNAQTAYIDSVKAWDKARAEDLRAPNGWVNLAGLFWLQPCINSFGRDSSNRVVYNAPAFPQQLGTWSWRGDSIYWITQPGYLVTVRGKRADSVLVWAGSQAMQQEFAYKHYRWTVIQRGEKTGVRFRDLQSAALDSFKGIARFPIDAAWRVPAHLVPKPGSTISITNVLGQTTPQPSAGSLEFSIGGSRYALEALDEGDGNLFIIFGDETNAEQTYPSGRFLYVPKPGPSGDTFIDFNKAENPPCAFTPYATCPLPPKQNRLPIAVMAGEKEVLGLKH